MCVMAIRFSEFRHYDQTISQPQMCVSLVRGSPALLLYWIGGGLVLVRAQLNLNHIDEGLGYIVVSAFVVVERRGISCGLAGGVVVV